MIMLIRIKQHPTNTWGLIYEKVQEKNENPETLEINRSCSKSENIHYQKT